MPPNLPERWAAPDNARLTAKQYSFRLPVHVAAKLAALEEMYPNRTRTQIVGDLLAAALDDVERSFPAVMGERTGAKDPETLKPLYRDVGVSADFRKLANKHYAVLEKELGNKAAVLYEEDAFTFTENKFLGK
jgi:predicted DNA-binding protein